MIDAREEVMTRLRRAAKGRFARRQRSCGFVQADRVAAALDLAREGAIRCWTETVGHNRTEVLVCELAPPRALPGPFDGGRVA